MKSASTMAGGLILLALLAIVPVMAIHESTIYDSSGAEVGRTLGPYNCTYDSSGVLASETFYNVSFSSPLNYSVGISIKFHQPRLVTNYTGKALVNNAPIGVSNVTTKPITIDGLPGTLQTMNSVYTQYLGGNTITKDGVTYPVPRNGPDSEVLQSFDMIAWYNLADRGNGASGWVEMNVGVDGNHMNLTNPNQPTTDYGNITNPSPSDAAFLMSILKGIHVTESIIHITYTQEPVQPVQEYRSVPHFDYTTR